MAHPDPTPDVLIPFTQPQEHDASEPVPPDSDETCVPETQRHRPDDGLSQKPGAEDSHEPSSTTVSPDKSNVSMTSPQSTKCEVLTSSRPSGPLLIRPTSSGDDISQGFQYAKASKPQLDFKGNRKGATMTNLILPVPESCTCRLSKRQRIHPRRLPQLHLYALVPYLKSPVRETSSGAPQNVAPHNVIDDLSTKDTLERHGTPIPTRPALSPVTLFGQPAEDVEVQDERQAPTTMTDQQSTIDPRHGQNVSAQQEQHLGLLPKRKRSTNTSPTFPGPPVNASQSDQIDDSAIRRVSSQISTPMVSKRKPAKQTVRESSVTSFCTMQAPHSIAQVPHHATDTGSVESITQVLLWTLQRDQETKRQKEADELQRLKLSECKSQSKLENITRSNNELSTELQRYKVIIAKYESKIARVEKFTNGIGNDLASLRNDNRTLGKSCSDLIDENRQRKAERDHLVDQLSIRTEKASALRKLMTKALREAEASYERANQHKEYLEQQLSEKVGLLAEERNRRAELEKQLNVTATTNHSELVKLLEEQQISVEASFQKMLGEALRDWAIPETYSKLEERLQLTSELLLKTIGSSENHSQFQDMVQSLADTIANGFARIAEAGNITAHSDALAANITKQLEQFRQECLRNDESQGALTDLRVANTTLSEKLVATEDKFHSITGQVEAARIHEATLNDTVVALQDELSLLRSANQYEDGDRSDAVAIEARNQSLGLEVEKLRAEVISSEEKIRAASEAEINLREELDELEVKIRDSEEASKALQSERDYAERKTSEKLNEVRAQVSRDAKKVIQDEKAKHENIAHQLRQKTSQLEVALNSKSAELNSLRQELKSCHDELESRDVEIQTLRENSIGNDKQLEKLRELTEETNIIRATSSDERKQHLTCVAELRLTLAQAEEQIRVQGDRIDKLQAESESTLAEMKAKADEELRQVNQALEETQRAKDCREREVEQTRKWAELSLREASKKFDGEKDDLHQRLNEAEVSLKEQERNLQNMKRDAEGALKTQSEKHKADQGEVQRRLLDAEVTREGLEAKIKDYARQEQQQRARNPRKKVDRNTNTVVSVERSTQDSYNSATSDSSASQRIGESKDVLVFEDQSSGAQDLGSQETLDERGVSFRSQIQETIIPETQYSQPLPFSQFNQRNQERTSPLTSLSDLDFSDIENTVPVYPPEASRNMRQRMDNDEERRILQCLPNDHRMSLRDSSPSDGVVRSQPVLGPNENPFFLSRPHSQANTSARLGHDRPTRGPAIPTTSPEHTWQSAQRSERAPTTLISGSQVKDPRKTSSPDFVERQSKVVTYRSSSRPLSSGNLAGATKRRGAHIAEATERPFSISGLTCQIFPVPTPNNVASVFDLPVSTEDLSDRKAQYHKQEARKTV
ncbi:hypothetical protein K490DRAFT_52700 [Saccharata proteae CBS 121410]|uniref:Uncharacterized protein n=1 Tax=Saccharata proteae CBS 121410 TaxID=1314787 RepID=A0A9P4LZU7_9PEZI|nr:hypothetical protein K490DRAFT_52700 [Saccharata proteae CBS 121410]